MKNEDEFLGKKVIFKAYYNADSVRVGFEGFVETGKVLDYNNKYPAVNGVVRVALVKCDDMITYSVPPDALELYEERR